MVSSNANHPGLFVLSMLRNYSDIIPFVAYKLVREEMNCKTGCIINDSGKYYKLIDK